MKPHMINRRHPVLDTGSQATRNDHSMWPEIPAFAGMTMLVVCTLILSGCGVQRPLMRPNDIPAYEEQQRKKREKIEQEQQELDAIDAKRAAERAVTTPLVSEPTY
jgi:hypothetical protein